MSSIKAYSLVYPWTGYDIWLGLKKSREDVEDQMGVGYYAGFGGHQEPDETIEYCALRELLEESDGIIGHPDTLKKVALLDIANVRFGHYHVHVYAVSEWHGEPHETDEMIPVHFNKADIPWDGSPSLRPSDAIWLPRVLEGERLYVNLWGDAQDNLIRHTLRTVESF